MDSSYQFPYTRVFRGSSQSQRLERINANPYDSFNDSQTSICSTASQKLVSYFKDKMSGVVSGLKGFFGAEEKPLLSSLVLTNSVTLPYIPSEKLNSISSSIQNTVQKPEYQDKYNNSLNASMISSGRSSVQNVMKFYKDVSVDKVREKIQKQDSKALDLSVSCAVKPKPVYSSVNTSLNSSRLDIGKDNFNVHGKRELRSILHDQNKTNKGNKKVSFGPELRRVDFPSSHHHLTYPKSSSSIIKYTSSDDEDTLCVDDRTQKKLFTTNTKIFIKPQTLNVSVIPTKKLKVNPFHKKVLEKNVLPKSAKLAKKQFPEDFARKYNHENSFGSDNLVNDSKLETDSDESNLHQVTFDHQNFINSLAKKKNQKRGGDYDSSSEISEKESPKLESPKTLAPIPLEDDEVDVDRIEDNNDEIQEEEPAPVEEPPKKVPETTKTSSLFGNLTSAAPVVEKKATENNAPALKLTGGLFANNTTESKPAEAKPASSGLFGGLNTTPVVTETKPAEVKPASSGLFGGLATPAATETKPVESKPAASSGLFGGSLFGGSINKPAPAAAETSEKNVPEEPKKTEESAPKVEAPVHSMFANLTRQASVVQHSNNPFLSASSQPKTVDFASLISGGAAPAPATTENTPAAVAEPMEAQTVETTMENNTNNNTSEPPAITGGFLGLISAKNNGQSSSMFSNTLKPTSNYSWMNTENNEEQKSTNLFGGMGGGMFGNNTNNNTSNNQSSMFTQNNPVNPFASSNNNQGGMNFEGGMGMGDNNNNNAGGMFGGFGNNNNNNNNNNFGGISRQGSSMSNGLFGGNSSGGFQNNMFGGNSGGVENNNPFLQSQNSFGGGGFGGGSSDNNLMRSNSTFGAGSAKKGKQKERAF